VAGSAGRAGNISSDEYNAASCCLPPIRSTKYSGRYSVDITMTRMPTYKPKAIPKNASPWPSII